MIEFNKNAESAIEFMKASTAPHDMLARHIRFEDGYLFPLGDISEDEAMLRILAAWRTTNVQAFPTQFTATVESTKRWVAERLFPANDRLLFIVASNKLFVGTVGIASVADGKVEIDHIQRGNDNSPGIMSRAVRALLEWVETTLFPDEIYLRVFSDNEHAIAFYERLGFVRDALLPLVAIRTPEMTSYVSAADWQTPDKHFLRMVYANSAVRTPIRTAGPSISAHEVNYALDAVKYGWNGDSDKYLRKFEEQFAAYIGVKHAIATSSCSGALELALMALGIGQGDEVIVPDITWVATASAVARVGAKPVFADVKRGSWCIDLLDAQYKVMPRTRAIIPVHLYGQPAAMGWNRPIIEDAAPAIGATIDGQRVGSFGAFGCFSFQGAKMLVTGEGGMLVTSDRHLYERARKLWDHGRRPGTFQIDEVGCKYKMSNVQAAIGLGQLERVGMLIEAKRRIHRWYEECLAEVPGIEFQTETPGTRSTYWMTSILVENRDRLAAALQAKGIDTRPVFPPLSSFPMWKQQTGPNAAYISAHGLNLPSGVCLRHAEVEYICDCIKEVLCGAN